MNIDLKAFDECGVRPWSGAPDGIRSLATHANLRHAVVDLGKVHDRATLFKALDLPGYSHHVLAGRLAGGWADTKSNAYFEVGGLSGSTFQVFSGYTIGEGRRTFPVRGFAPATLRGIRAVWR